MLLLEIAQQLADDFAFATDRPERNHGHVARAAIAGDDAERDERGERDANARARRHG